MGEMVPYSVLCRVTPRVTWRDIRFGLARNLIFQQVAVDHAICELEQGSNCNDVLSVAVSRERDWILPIIDRLASSEAGTIDDCCERTFYRALLTWLYENRQRINDPLGVVERVYADFGYPDELKTLVRYMPSDAPDLGTKEKNEERLIREWAELVAQWTGFDVRANERELA